MKCMATRFCVRRVPKVALGQPVPQSRVVAKSESDFAKDLQLWLNDSI
jgi:hypothetical protein